MEVASLVVAVLAVLAAGGSLLYAKGANDRADVANARAEEAIDLQKRIDERDREFRAVEWDANVANQVNGVVTEYVLTNAGDSDAMSVTVVLYLNPDREVHHVGDIAARQSVTITSPLFIQWMREAVEHEVVTPGARVHWSSRLGQVGDERVSMKTFADFIVQDDY